MKHCAALLVLLICLVPVPALAWRGFVEEVPDGASVIVREEGSGRKVLVGLYGIAVPVRNAKGQTQPYGDEAYAKARDLLPRDLPVDVHDMRQDTMGRDKGGMVTLPGGKTLQEELLAAGLAWVAPLHCGNCWDWKRLERRARAEGIGLWRDDNPVPPWEWP